MIFCGRIEVEVGYFVVNVDCKTNRIKSIFLCAKIRLMKS